MIETKMAKPPSVGHQLISEHVHEFQCHPPFIRGDANDLHWSLIYSKLGRELSHSKLSKCYPFGKLLAGERYFSQNPKTNVAQHLNWTIGHSKRLDSTDGEMTHTEQRLIGIIEDFA